uniref:Secreted protein n=1 Tax=Labrus bergylta TaxID=56723 RepID=A0A3Q3FVX1_9LABR
MFTTPTILIFQILGTTLTNRGQAEDDGLKITQGHDQGFTNAHSCFYALTHILNMPRSHTHTHTHTHTPPNPSHLSSC